MQRTRTYKVSFGALLLFAAAIWLLVSLPGCHGRQPLLRTTVRDSVAVHVQTIYRDTVIYTPADSASTTLGTDWTAMHKLMAELDRAPRVVRGERQASVVITKVDSAHFQVQAQCAAMQVKLDSALQVIDQRTLQLRRVEEQVAVHDRADRFRMPGWAKGIALAAGSLGGLALLVALLPTLKQLFRNGTA